LAQSGFRHRTYFPARLGVEAPKEVPVHRREVYDAIKRTEAQNGEASEAARGEG